MQSTASTALLSGTAVLIPASLTLTSTTPCELWLDACVLHQRTTFPSSQASNLLSFVAKDPHCLYHTVPWSLNTWSTQHSSLHRVRMHGVSNRDTNLYPPHNNFSFPLTTMAYVRRTGLITNGNGECLDNPTRLCTFISDTDTHPPGLTLPRTTWVWFNRLRTGVQTFSLLVTQKGMACSAACECGAKEQNVGHIVLQCPTHRRPHGLHGLTVLEDETIELLFNTCPEI